MLGLSILGLLPNGGQIIGGSIKLGGRELVGLPDARAAQAPRQRGRDDLPGLAVLAEPDQDDRRAGRRAGPAAPRRVAQGGARPRARGARAGRAAAAAASASSDYPASALGRPAPARDDRGRARLRAEGAARRRADDRARRHDPGPDPRAARRPRAIASGWRRCSSRTTWASSPGGPTGSTSCTPGGSSRRRATEEIFGAMRHPYTQALLGSIPRLEQDNRKALVSIPGLPPDLTQPSAGLPLRAALPARDRQCRAQEPPLDGSDPGHLFACWHPVDGPIERTGDRRRRTLHGRLRHSERQRPSARDRRRRARVPGHGRSGPPAQGQLGQGRLRRVAARRRRRGARAGRRVRVRQDDAREADRRRSRSRMRDGSRSTGARSSDCAGARCGARAATCR